MRKIRILRISSGTAGDHILSTAGSLLMQLSIKIISRSFLLINVKSKVESKILAARDFWKGAASAASVGSLPTVTARIYSRI